DVRPRGNPCRLLALGLFQLFLKVSHRGVGIEPDLQRVGANERAAEDTARQPLEVVALECLERRHRNLGPALHLAQRQSGGFAHLPQPLAKGFHAHWEATTPDSIRYKTRVSSRRAPWPRETPVRLPAHL